MNFQNIVDNQSLDRLPAVKRAIDSANAFESNQMRCYTIGAMLNSVKAIDKMATGELAMFESGLLAVFASRNWV